MIGPRKRAACTQRAHSAILRCVEGDAETVQEAVELVARDDDPEGLRDLTERDVTSLFEEHDLAQHFEEGQA